MKENEDGRTCSTHVGWEKCLQGSGWEATREETRIPISYPVLESKHHDVG
jgi:hypothetical protein